MNITTITSLALAVAFASTAGTAYANDISSSGKPLTTQQQRMKDCNADAKTQSLKGDARKAFMSTCLKGHSPEATAATVDKSSTANAPSSKQLKRKACSADAKSQGLKGDDRKAFIGSCMKAEVASSS